MSTAESNNDFRVEHTFIGDKNTRTTFSLEDREDGFLWKVQKEDLNAHTEVVESCRVDHYKLVEQVPSLIKDGGLLNQQTFSEFSQFIYDRLQEGKSLKESLNRYSIEVDLTYDPANEQEQSQQVATASAAPEQEHTLHPYKEGDYTPIPVREARDDAYAERVEDWKKEAHDAHVAGVRAAARELNKRMLQTVSNRIDTAGKVNEKANDPVQIDKDGLRALQKVFTDAVDENAKFVVDKLDGQSASIANATLNTAYPALDFEAASELKKVGRLGGAAFGADVVAYKAGHENPYKSVSKTEFSRALAETKSKIDPSTGVAPTKNVADPEHLGAVAQSASRER